MLFFSSHTCSNMLIICTSAAIRRTFGGQGSFPDEYPNKTNPLPATVHIPNIYIALDAAGGSLPSPTDPDLVKKVLGLDNAFALNLTSIIEGVTRNEIAGCRQSDILRTRLFV